MRTRSHRTRRARTRVGRATTVLATAAALATAVQVADAEPADADYCIGGISYFSGNWDTSGYCYDEYLAEIVGSVFQNPPGQTYVPPAPTDVLSFVTPTPEDVTQARKDATEALKITACNVVVTGARDNDDLNQRKARGEDAASVLPAVPAGSAGAAHPNGIYAEVNRLSARPQRVGGQGALKDGVITVYNPFHNATWANTAGVFTAPGETVVRQLPDGSVDATPPTAEMIKAAILLHEVGHLTGANVHGPTEFRAPINRLILQACFGYTFVPPPAPSPPPPGRPPACTQPPCAPPSIEDPPR